MSNEEKQERSDFSEKESRPQVDPKERALSDNSLSEKKWGSNTLIAMASATAAFLSAIFALVTWQEANRVNESNYIRGLENILIELESTNQPARDPLEGQTLSNKRIVLLASAEHIMKQLKGDLHPAHVGVLANGYLQAGDVKMAAEYFLTAAEHPDSSDILSAAGYRSLAQIYAYVPGWKSEETASKLFQKAYGIFASRDDQYAE